jgi:hypothetical protein
MSDPPDPMVRLTERMEALERRVFALEHPAQSAGAVIPPPVETALVSHPSPATLAGGAFAVLGKAMLGIAGAYLLRAVAESSSFPRLWIAALAIAYAILWLLFAARASARLSTLVYAGTSVLILAPMIWELTLSFKVLTAVESAAVLCAFAVVASAVAWKLNLTSIFWIAHLTVAALAFALSIATHEMLPFIAALLLLALLSEVTAFRGHGQSVSPLVAVVADLAVAVQFYIYSSPPNERMDYPLLGTVPLLLPSLSLFLISGACAVIEAAFFARKISAFKALQATVAFLLLTGCVLAYLSHAGWIVFGVFCLLSSAAGYATVLRIFCRLTERRNERVFGSWSAALFVAGCALCLPTPLASASLAVAAMAVTLLGIRWNRPLLYLHGAAYLIASAIASGLLLYFFHALVGELPGAPHWSVLLAALSAVVCYMARKPALEVTGERKLLDLVSALLAVSAMAAFLVEALVLLAASFLTPASHHIAFIRTFTICAAILALAFAGSRWRRVELMRIGYLALLMVAVKMIFEDLRIGHLEFVAASIFLFAITLIVIPRLRIKEPLQEAQNH